MKIIRIFIIDYLVLRYIIMQHGNLHMYYRNDRKKCENNIVRFEQKKLLNCISCAILICAPTAKAKHTRMRDNLISTHQNSARGKQRTQLTLLLKYSATRTFSIYLKVTIICGY